MWMLLHFFLVVVGVIVPGTVLVLCTGVVVILSGLKSIEGPHGVLAPK